MTKARFDGLLFFFFGCAVFVALGVGLEHVTRVSMIDFRSLYYGARCFLQHSDPYREGDLLRIYRGAGADRASDPATVRQVVVQYMNLPSMLVLTTPLAMLSWGAAYRIWMAVTASCYVLAAYLMWSFGARTAPRISGVLVFLYLCGSELLLEVGNSAGIAVSLSVIAVWCFLSDRFEWMGVLCLSLGLLMKPHVTGPILLYFLFAGRKNTRRALQTAAVTLILAAAAVLWVSHVAPDWYSELQTSLHAALTRGGMNDPGPTTLDTRAHAAAVVGLQTVFSLMKDDPRFYNAATYLVCVPLFVVWGTVVLRNRFSRENAWLALAAIAALSMLPLYHRQHDTRLLLLTIPAQAVLWAEGRLIAWSALLFTTASAFLTGDMTDEFLAVLAHHLRLSDYGFLGQLLNVVLIRPVPLILLAAGIFYLWAYLRYAARPESPSSSKKPAQELHAPERTGVAPILNSSFGATI